MRSKKRRVTELTVAESASPSGAQGFSPWVDNCDLSSAFDAPTVRITDDGRENDSASNFSSLGSVLGKLDSFRTSTQRVPTTLSTVPSSLGVLVPVGPALVTDGDLTTLAGLQGYTQKMLIETDCGRLFDRFSSIYDDLVCFCSKKFDVRDLVTALSETPDGWAVIEIPGPFNTLGCVQLTVNRGNVTAIATGIQLRGERSLQTELERYGVQFTLLCSAIKDKKEIDDSSSEEETVSAGSPAGIKISGRADVFGFFDSLIHFDVFSDSRRLPSAFASFPFADCVATYPKISVRDAAGRPGFKYVQIERVCVPLHVVETFVDAALTNGTARTSFQSAPTGGSINLVKRI